MNPNISDMCHICNSGQETVSHLFWYCTRVKPFWGRVFQLLSLLVPGYHVPVPELDIILNPFSVFAQSVFPIVISVYGMAFWAIWKSYLGIVFEGDQFSDVALNEQFIRLLKLHVNLLLHIACKKGKMEQFAKVWINPPHVTIEGGRIKLQIIL